MSCITSIDEIVKNDAETLAVSMNFEAALNGATISTHAISITPSGITVSSDADTDTEVTFMVAGGTDGYNYRVEVTVTTSSGETLVGIGTLKVRGG